jgi:hypothetical protein
VLRHQYPTALLCGSTLASNSHLGFCSSHGGFELVVLGGAMSESVSGLITVGLEGERKDLLHFSLLLMGEEVIFIPLDINLLLHPS